jgi:inosine-uridine nucleoside N-ribohydrolase
MPANGLYSSFIHGVKKKEPIMLMPIKTHLNIFSGASLRPGRKFLILVLAIIGLLALFGTGAYDTFARRDPVKLIVDTDMGVDDAMAVAWLLSQDRYPVEILGITSVAGNTTTENAANNVLTLLDTTGRTDVPVVIGAAAPLLQPLSFTGASNHGPDGLWFVGLQNPHDLSDLPTDVPAFFCAQAAPDVTLVALGPLTNVAQAAALCPNEMNSLKEIIILGGSKEGGNRSPVAEFNVWIDPEAAGEVLAANLPTTWIPRDAFDTFTITQEEIDDLAADGIPVAQLLSFPLQFYADSQTGLVGLTTITVPDVTAVIYAVKPNLGTPQSGLIKIVTGITEDSPERILRGKTVIGLTFGDRIPMIADDEELSLFTQNLLTDPDFDFEAAIGAILAREPDNAQVVMDIRERQMRRLFMRELTN